ncbi:hypothetical protein A2U01_0028528 [Trifolium medium]|uniref:Uncharacterized protein n=1 Tax=Trifolium medium TaxID=97028 RepID=A0A392P7L1_9FABA|nr:hypothetical protein [Trifolium medium]
MGERIEALEEHMSEVKTTLQSLVQQMQQQSLVISEMSKQLGMKKMTQVSKTFVEESSQSESCLVDYTRRDPVAWSI